MLRITTDFTEKIIQILKKDPAYKLDPALDSCSLLQINIQRLFSVIRGMLRSPIFGSKRGYLFLGSNVKLISPKLMSIGRSVTIEDNVVLNALSKNGIRIGDNTKIARFSIIECTGVIRNVGEGLSIGNNSAVGAYSYLGAQGGIEIGNNVIMGPRVSFHSENHIFTDKNTPIRLQGEVRKKIIVDDDCWVGTGSIILAGVHIHSSAVIAAGAVVTKDVPSNSVVAGVPAKIIKNR